LGLRRVTQGLRFCFNWPHNEVQFPRRPVAAAAGSWRGGAPPCSHATAWPHPTPAQHGPTCGLPWNTRRCGAPPAVRVLTAGCDTNVSEQVLPQFSGYRILIYCKQRFCSEPSTELSSVGFEVFTAVVMKSIIFWDVTPCSLLSCNRHFGGTYLLHLQGRKNNFRKNHQVSRWHPEGGGDMFLRNVCRNWTFSLPPAYLLVLAKIISSTLKMEAICSSETSVASQQTTRRHIPEDDTLQQQKLFTKFNILRMIN
jgi:hypothetical protein